MDVRSIGEAINSRRDVLERYKVKRLGVFGSHARGEASSGSDVDILVEFRECIDLFDFINLAEEMGSLLGSRVDLVTPDAIKPAMRDSIMREVRWIEGL
ncbi:MAG: nucleotidyltransferase family protein [Candidatus Methanosuratincola sp.]|nr:nucleotidyltransferase family protein [Candidatus Methanosuratincola sp.]